MAGSFMSNSSKVSLLWMSLWGLNGLVHIYAKCGSIEDAQQVFNKMPPCDLVSCKSIDIGTCEMWVRTEGTATILTSATAACATKLCYFFGGGAECMCWLGCA
jgi:hypothetical protein